MRKIELQKKLFTARHQPSILKGNLQADKTHPGRKEYPTAFGVLCFSHSGT